MVCQANQSKSQNCARQDGARRFSWEQESSTKERAPRLRRPPTVLIVFLPGRPAFVNPLGVRDGVRNGALPRRAWLGAYFVKFSCCKDRCGKKDCVFPLLVHLSPPAETGQQDSTQRYWTLIFVVGDSETFNFMRSLA